MFDKGLTTGLTDGGQPFDVSPACGSSAYSADEHSYVSEIAVTKAELVVNTPEFLP